MRPSRAPELVLEPKEYTVFGQALERCREDARVRVRLGAPLSGYGVESSSRAARQRIRHKVETDAAGIEHVLVQFQLRGPRGVATVLAEGVADRAAPGGYRLAFIRVADPGGALRPIAVEPVELPGGALGGSYGAAQPSGGGYGGGAGFGAAPAAGGGYGALPPPLALEAGGAGLAGDAQQQQQQQQAAPRAKSIWGTLTGR